MALELAARGCGFVQPNPMVGAVLVKSDRIVGRGYHRVFGGPHAEIEALNKAGARARGADMYVTMEPCCFHGKTGACTEAIKAAGVRRVFAAMLDPHPKVRGRGMKCLQRAGIETHVGLLGDDARKLNEAYVRFHSRRRPFVVLKLALSLDGMVATSSGESKWITGPEAREYGQKLRQSADAILVGVDTVLNDNPRLCCRMARRQGLLKVVLDPELRTPPTSRFLKTKGQSLILTTKAGEGRKEVLQKRGAEVVEITPGKNGLFDWNRILAELRRREVVSLLIEGGATVAASALDDGAVDKVCLFHAPKVIGPGRSFGMKMKPRSLRRALVLKDLERKVMGQDVMTEGYVLRK